MKLGDQNIPLFLTLFQTFASALSFIETKAGAVSSVYLRKMSDGIRSPILSRLENTGIESRYRAISLSAISLLGNILISAVGPLVGYMMEKTNVATTLGLSSVIGIFLVLPSALYLSRELRSH